MYRPSTATVLTAVFLMAACLPAAANGDNLSEQELRGRHIYLTGTSPSGADIVALVGDARTEVPASILPCGGCHGPDGRGRPDTELKSADLTWPVLTSRLDDGGPGSRRRPPYDERLLKRAITRGLDAAANSLHVAMPRYRLTLRDTADLIAYLRRRDSKRAVGAPDPVSED